MASKRYKRINLNYLEDASQATPTFLCLLPLLAFQKNIWKAATDPHPPSPTRPPATALIIEYLVNKLVDI